MDTAINIKSLHGIQLSQADGANLAWVQIHYNVLRLG